MDDPKLFDVARPGQSAAGPSSRPIIASRSPLQPDPMVSSTNNPRPVITPPQNLNTTPRVATPPEPIAAAAPTGQTDMPATATETKNQKALDEAKKQEAQNAHLEEVQKLAESKKFVLPIGETHKTNLTRHLILAALAGLIISFVILYLAVDAGFIKTSIKLPIDLIQNN